MSFWGPKLKILNSQGGLTAKERLVKVASGSNSTVKKRFEENIVK